VYVKTSRSVRGWMDNGRKDKIGGAEKNCDVHLYSICFSCASIVQLFRVTSRTICTGCVMWAGSLPLKDKYSCSGVSMTARQVGVPSCETYMGARWTHTVVSFQILVPSLLFTTFQSILDKFCPRDHKKRLPNPCMCESSEKGKGGRG